MSEDSWLNEPVATFDAAEVGVSAKTWTLALFPHHLALVGPDGAPHKIESEELSERVRMIERGLLLRRTMIVRLKRTVFFQLTADSFTLVSAWIGPPTVADLRVALKRRFSLVLPISALIIVTALPIGILPWDPVSLGLGAALFVTGALAKLAPHRILFAVDSMWFSFQAAKSIWLLMGMWNWGPLAFLVMDLIMVQSGLQEYRRFAPERMAGAKEGAGSDANA